MYALLPQTMYSPLDRAKAERKLAMMGQPLKPRPGSYGEPMFPTQGCVVGCAVDRKQNSGYCERTCIRNMPQAPSKSVVSPSARSPNAYMLAAGSGGQGYNVAYGPEREMAQKYAVSHPVPYVQPQAPTPWTGFDERVCLEATIPQCAGDPYCMWLSTHACSSTGLEPGDIIHPNGASSLPRSQVTQRRVGQGMHVWPWHPRSDRPPTTRVRVN